MSREKETKRSKRKEDTEDSRLSAKLVFKGAIWNTEVNTGFWLPKESNHLQAGIAQERFSLPQNLFGSCHGASETPKK